MNEVLSQTLGGQVLGLPENGPARKMETASRKISPRHLRPPLRQTDEKKRDLPQDLLH